MRFSTILTSEQARMLFDDVKERRDVWIARTSFGIWDGLLISLAQIDRGGGALLRDCPIRFDYAAIIPASTYIAWPGVKTMPRPFWELAAILPKLSVEHEGEIKVWLNVSVYRATSPLAIIPLAAAVLPGPPLSRAPLPLK